MEIVPQISSDRRHEPWIPAEFSIRPVRRIVARSRPTVTKQQRVKERTAWDLRWAVDGKRYFRRFDRAADADAYADELRRNFALHLPFDPASRRFVDPTSTGAPSEWLPPLEPGEQDTTTETVHSWTQRYWERKWPTLEPRGRRELARYLNRARRWLVDDEPKADVASAVDGYVARDSLTVDDRKADPDHEPGRQWLESHSLAMTAVGRAELERLVQRFGMNSRDPSRRVAASSIRRMVADLRPCWDRAVLEEIIPANPWAQVDLGLRARAGGKRTSTAVVAADADLVLDPARVVQLADACAVEGRWGDSVRAFVLVMGLCGLRPNEAAGLLVGDLDLPDRGPGWLTVRRNRREVPDRFLEADEDPDWGPLKGREITDIRRVPIPTGVVGALRRHLHNHRSNAGALDLAFERNGRPFNLSAFHTQVWTHGRAALSLATSDRVSSAGSYIGSTNDGPA